MKFAGLAKLLPIICGLAAILLLAQWTLSRPNIGPMQLRVPGADRIDAPVAVIKPADLHGTLVAGPAQPTDDPATLPGAWPRFRGAAFDNIAPEPLALPGTWPKTAPKQLWRIDTGEGYAGPAILNGRVYLLDYDQKKQADVLRCLSLTDGGDIWDRSYPAEVKRNHGMSRTVPAVTERFVVTMGPKCDVLCVNTQSGDYLWGLDLIAEFHGKIPPWYTGQCPLIDQDRAIVAPGGDALMIAVDCATGKLLWKTPNPKNWEMTHSSIMPMNFNGQRMYIYCASGGVAGISAQDGTLLWDTGAWKVSMANVPSPVIIGEDRIFLSGGYGAGSMMLQLKNEAGKIALHQLYKLLPETFGAEQQTPIYYKGYLYGVIPGGQLVCLNPADGKPLWNSAAQRFGIGPYLITNDLIFLLNDTGTFSVVRATSEHFQLLAQYPIIEQAHECWGPMALAGGRLLARDLRHVVCLNLLEVGHD